MEKFNQTFKYTYYRVVYLRPNNIWIHNDVSFETMEDAIEYAERNYGKIPWKIVQTKATRENSVIYRNHEIDAVPK